MKRLFNIRYGNHRRAGCEASGKVSMRPSLLYCYRCAGDRITVFVVDRAGKAV